MVIGPREITSYVHQKPLFPAQTVQFPWRLESSGEQVEDGLPKPVTRDVEGTFFDFVAQPWGDAQGAENRGVKILDHDPVLDCLARTLVGRLAMEIAAFDSAAKHQHAPGVGKMTVHAVIFHF